MTRLKGKVISRPLTMVPQEGAQVIRHLYLDPNKLHIETVQAVRDNRIEFKSAGGYYIGIEGLYELCIEFFTTKIVPVPLKYSQWQAAIANGEVDSDKLVEFEFVDKPGTIGTIAKIIPAKTTAQTWEEIFNRFDGINTKWYDIRTAYELLVWLKETYHPPTKLKQ